MTGKKEGKMRGRRKRDDKREERRVKKGRDRENEHTRSVPPFYYFTEHAQKSCIDLYRKSQFPFHNISSILLLIIS